MIKTRDYGTEKFENLHTYCRRNGFGLGPFVTDFYLPAFPNLVTYFDTDSLAGAVEFDV